jgi:hypothetical protein
MAKSRRARLPADRRPHGVAPDIAAPGAAPGAAPSAAPGPAADPPAAVIDVVPVSAVSVPARVMSPFERGIEFVSRPFGIVFVLGLATLAAIWNRRNLSLLLVAGALVSGACRATPIWSGVEFLPNGHLKLAAEEPSCGCLSIANQIGKDLALRSSFHGTTVGQATLKATDTLEFRFDWAGSANDDFYEIRAVDGAGAEVNMKTAVRIDYKTSWIKCSTAKCPYGDLALDLGQNGH